MKIVTFRGPINLEQLIDSIRSHGRVACAPMKLLVDMTDAQLRTEPNDVRLLARTLTRADDDALNPGKLIGRISIITRDASTFGFLRMFEAYADGASVEIHVCRDIESASDWLNGAGVHAAPHPSDPVYRLSPQRCG